MENPSGAQSDILLRLTAAVGICDAARADVDLGKQCASRFGFGLPGRSLTGLLLSAEMKTRDLADWAKAGVAVTTAFATGPI